MVLLTGIVIMPGTWVSWKIQTGLKDFFILLYVLTAGVFGTFVMLAAGRIDPQEQIDAGTITWSGDAEWGERAARNLAYTG